MAIDLKNLGVGVVADAINKINKQNGENNNTTVPPVFINGTYSPSDTVNSLAGKITSTEGELTKLGDFSWDNSNLYKDLQNKYLTRPDFSYDFNADALYQQYKDKYIQQGKMAMADTIGQASAMTGGYGNSYAATVGNQAYQASLQNLNDIVPELYQMAYDRYNQKGQDMLNQLGVLENDYSMKHGDYMDKYNKLVDDRTYYTNAHAAERTHDYTSWNDSIDRTNSLAQQTYENEINAKNTAITNARDDVYKAISTGVMPSDAMIAAAGLDKATVAAMAKVYKDANDQGANKTIYSGTTKKSTTTKTEDKTTVVKDDDPVDDGAFKGSTYKEALAFLKSKNAYNGGLMTQNEWARRRAAYQRTGQGGSEVTKVSSYQDYLKYIVPYMIETYGK